MKSFIQFFKWITKCICAFYTGKPRIIIVSHFYQDQEIQILIRDKQGNLQVHPLQNVARKKTIINQLSASDAFLLGYLLAEQDQDNSFIPEKSFLLTKD